MSIPELAVSSAFEIAALIGVLERKARPTHTEILKEIAHQKKGWLRER